MKICYKCAIITNESHRDSPFKKKKLVLNSNIKPLKHRAKVKVLPFTNIAISKQCFLEYIYLHKWQRIFNTSKLTILSDIKKF